MGQGTVHIGLRGVVWDTYSVYVLYTYSWLFCSNTAFICSVAPSRRGSAVAPAPHCELPCSSVASAAASCSSSLSFPPGHTACWDAGEPENTQQEGFNSRQQTCEHKMLQRKVHLFHNPVVITAGAFWLLLVWSRRVTLLNKQYGEYVYYVL